MRVCPIAGNRFREGCAPVLPELDGAEQWAFRIDASRLSQSRFCPDRRAVVAVAQRAVLPAGAMMVAPNSTRRPDLTGEVRLRNE